MLRKVIFLHILKFYTVEMPKQDFTSILVCSSVPTDAFLLEKGGTNYNGTCFICSINVWEGYRLLGTVIYPRYFLNKIADAQTHVSWCLFYYSPKLRRGAIMLLTDPPGLQRVVYINLYVSTLLCVKYDMWQRVYELFFLCSVHLWNDKRLVYLKPALHL